MITEKYYEKVVDALTRIKETQGDKILTAAAAVARTIESDGIIYIFGCGHSHMIALDGFYRAGGLACVSPVLDTDLMLHNGGAKSSVMEKMSGIAPSIFERYCITERDVLFVISTSGKNSVPVEMAECARQNGVYCVSIVSGDYFGDKKDKPMLYEVSDLYIDNCTPHGDAVMELSGIECNMGSISTATSSFIMQSVLMEGAQIAAANGAEVPVYMSGNIEGGAEYNKALIKKYIPRIKHL